MALIADDARDRAEQILVMTERLTAIAAEETRLIEARAPLPTAGSEEKNRLTNAYRLELARVKQDPSLIKDAPPELLAELRRRTVTLHETLAAHEIALSAVKALSEGLVHAMAEEIARQRDSGAGYSSGGALDVRTAPSPTVLDRSA